ncbi:class I SAM-dependent methyltransferase [Shewanella glacialipiscicola]|uniref:class I SAM-dependent methyltransferase n=1 Tax=Shewanella glacialipiscicola TaxID=614069 RepID=UPI0021D935A7|nr:class I SAM-dependent methyltransferase [Shewanella glacialipiscicola]MCU7996262.1 class I SAM-dependent methyltransferase [Shewanella glacialipiscicola]MCU8027575.1 class I SAM-dependent methyltransferase [Shewanella glacialipiscicola]
MEQWTNYWQHTFSLNSFAEGKAAFGYNGELQRFWHKKMPNTVNDTNILDIGTGNGALAVLCYQYAASLRYSWSITAIDVADINPKKNKYEDVSINDALDYIEFFGGTAIEFTSFNDSKFDFLCSQFSLEYSNLILALPECVRLLKPGGKLCAVMHSERSHIVLDSKIGLEVLNVFLIKSDIFILVEKTLMLAEELLKRGEKVKGNSTFNLLNASLLKSVSILQQQVKNEENQHWFDSVIGVIAPLLYKLSIGNINIFTEYVKQLTYYRMRIIDQLDAVMNEKRIKEVNNILSRLSVQCSWSELIIENQYFGCILEARKAS